MYTLAMDCSSRITATMCAYKLNNARYENLFSHAVAVIRLNQYIAYIYFSKTFPTTHF